MSEIKDRQKTPESKTKWGIFRRRKPVEDEVNEFIIGDLDEKGEVTIGVNGAIAGNLSARTVRIKGTVFGSVTAPEVIIDQSGQVWGDVFASTLMITVNAKVHGWVSTFDVGTLELIQSGALSASDVMSINLSAQPDTLVKLRQSAGVESTLGNLSSQPELYRRFQVEGGSSIIARLELERSYGVGPSTAPSEVDQLAEITSSDEGDKISASVLSGSNSDVLQAELSRTLQYFDETNAELALISSELMKSNEKVERLKTDRDLFKSRFRKLALWVYQNKRSALK